MFVFPIEHSRVLGASSILNRYLFDLFIIWSNPYLFSKYLWAHHVPGTLIYTRKATLKNVLESLLSWSLHASGGKQTISKKNKRICDILNGGKC